MPASPFRPTAPGIFYPEGPGVAIRLGDLGAVIAEAEAHPRRRARLCAHPGPDAALHEMLIVLQRGGYVRPHRHRGRPESFLVLEGEARVLAFDEAGTPTACWELGDMASGRTFFLRMETPTFHTVIVDSPRLIVMETTQGPFDPASTEAAPWAPEEGDPLAATFIERALGLWKERS